MRKLTAFTFLSLNGFFKGPDERIDWHPHGEEGNEFSLRQLQSDPILLFGRKTYELMQSFWPSEMALNLFPAVAKKMNECEKLVASRSLNSTSWQNSTLLSGPLEDHIRSLKNTPGKNITILGSGSLLTQLTSADLIDQYEFLIDPVAIGQGTAVFSNLSFKLDLKLTGTQVFEKSGSVLLTYQRQR